MPLAAYSEAVSVLTTPTAYFTVPMARNRTLWRGERGGRSFVNLYEGHHGVKVDFLTSRGSRLARSLEKTSKQTETLVGNPICLEAQEAPRWFIVKRPRADFTMIYNASQNSAERYHCETLPRSALPAPYDATPCNTVALQTKPRLVLRQTVAPFLDCGGGDHMGDALRIPARSGKGFPLVIRQGGSPSINF